MVFLWQLKMAAENPGTAAKEAYDEKVRPLMLLPCMGHIPLCLDAVNFAGVNFQVRWFREFLYNNRPGHVTGKGQMG